MQHELERFIATRVGAAVVVGDLQRISSVGNAREPWSFVASWQGTEQRCVMLVKAAAGQLETTLRPEFETIAAVAGRGVAAPPALWLDEEGEAFGSPFFVTGFVPGTADTRVLRRDDDPTVREVARQLAVQAARLHAVDPASCGHLAPATVQDAAPTQLVYWEELFRRQRLEAHPGLVYALRWMRDRYPVARRVSVVHGDLRFGNLLYHGDRLTALLDWEMTHLGDPVEDLGWVYRSLWSPQRSLPFEEFLSIYEAEAGEAVDRVQLRWYQVFNEFKHAVISLTAARSFADRATTSLRHADRAATVPPFVRRILELVADDAEEEVAAPC